MVRQSPKPPAARLNGWGAPGQPHGGRRFLTSAKFAEMRRKQADLNEKLWQLIAAERERRGISKNRF